MVLKIKVNRGDTLVRSFEVKKDREPVDISDWIFRLTVKRSVFDSYSEAVIKKVEKEHDQPVEGRTSIVLRGYDTDIEEGTYHFDVQVENGIGDRRSVKGMFVVERGAGWDA